MKIRQSFVTNSSSSSFIVAIKRDIILEDLIESIDKDKVIEYFKDYNIDLSEEYDGDINSFISSACSELYCSFNYSLNLDDWKVIGGELYTEDLDYNLGHALIYYGCIKESDRIKIG